MQIRKIRNVKISQREVGSGTLNDCKSDATSTNTTQGKRTENQKKNKVKSNLDNNVVINEQQTLESDSNVVT